MASSTNSSGTICTSTDESISGDCCSSRRCSGGSGDPVGENNHLPPHPPITTTATIATTNNGGSSTTATSQEQEQEEEEEPPTTTSSCNNNSNSNNANANAEGADVEEFEDEKEIIEDSGPTNIDQIDHKLYLGNLAAACDTTILEKYRITFILTVDSCPLPTKITHLPYVQTKYIQISDMPREDILQYFDETFMFIEQAVTGGDENGCILVHCYFGVSRSATIVMAYLMRKYHISVDEAQERVKARRHVIGPNFGFLSQLKLYEIMGYKIDRQNLFYKRFRLHVCADKVKSVKILPHPYTDVVKPDPSLLCVKPEPVVYQCKKCRRILAAASNLLLHNENKSPLWFDFQQSEEDSTTTTATTNICTQMHFIEPLAWMTNVPHNLQGKIHCPNQSCKSKLGSFSWIMGILCPCGAKVSPAFYLIPSKVDRSTSVLNLQITL